MSRTCLRYCTCLALAAHLLGCSTRLDFNGGVAGADAAGGRGGRAGGLQAGASGVGLVGTNAGRTGSTDERCDGLDNDGNGIVDDVDAQHDGVCDCLSIATIGQIGPWSNGGNVFKSWLNSRSPTPAVELSDKVLTDELLRPYQIIVVLYAAAMELTGNGRTLTAHHTFSDDEVEAFGRWVRHGGGVMTTSGYTADELREVVNVNRLLSPLGMGYSTTKLDVEGDVERWEPHPLTRQVRKIHSSNGVQPDGADGTSLAHDTGDRVVLQVTQPEQGHVVVWGDEWITYDSQWQDVRDQQVERLWLNILKWMSPALVCQVPIGPD